MGPEGRDFVTGRVVDDDDASANQYVLIDVQTHGGDGESLVAIGISDFPEGEVNIRGEESRLNEWLSHWRNYYHDKVSNRATWNYLEPSGIQLPKGWSFLPKLSGIPNGKLTERFIARIGEEKFARLLPFGHCSVSSYPTILVSHPLTWFLLKHGTLRVGDDTVSVAAMVARRNELALAELLNVGQLLPAFQPLDDGRRR